MTTNAVSRFLPALAIASTLALATTQTGCIGSYAALNKVASWNKTLTDSKWVNSIVHLAFWIVPVYELTIAGDFLIFNNVEFLTGSNPIGK